MRVAIIGGGASGVVTAYLLAGIHDVHLFEKTRMLGGNIRTLNRNVRSASLPQGVHVENGVLGLHQGTYPTFHRLMSELGIELTSFAMHNGMFLEMIWRMQLEGGAAARKVDALSRSSAFYRIRLLRAQDVPGRYLPLTAHSST